jgi:hypothetical protein
MWLFGCVWPQATVHACIFGRNSAIDGGAVHLQDQANVVASNSTFTANRASGSAGAIFAHDNSSLALTTAVMQSNSAKSGGAVALYDTAAAAISSLSCSGNAAAAEGGCAHMESSRVSLNNTSGHGFQIAAQVLLFVLQLACLLCGCLALRSSECSTQCASEGWSLLAGD